MASRNKIPHPALLSLLGFAILMHLVLWALLAYQGTIEYPTGGHTWFFNHGPRWLHFFLFFSNLTLLAIGAGVLLLCWTKPLVQDTQGDWDFKWKVQERPGLVILFRALAGLGLMAIGTLNAMLTIALYD